MEHTEQNQIESPLDQVDSEKPHILGLEDKYKDLVGSKVTLGELTTYLNAQKSSIKDKMKHWKKGEPTIDSYVQDLFIQVFEDEKNKKIDIGSGEFDLGSVSGMTSREWRMFLGVFSDAEQYLASKNLNTAGLRNALGKVAVYLYEYVPDNNVSGDWTVPMYDGEGHVKMNTIPPHLDDSNESVWKKMVQRYANGYTKVK